MFILLFINNLIWYKYCSLIGWLLITKGIQRLHIKVRNLSTHVMLSTNTSKLHNFSKIFYFIWTFILLIKITIYLHWEFVISYNVCYIGINVIIYRYSVEKKNEILLTFKICLYKNDHLFALGIGHLVTFYIILIVLDLSVKNANSCIHLENVCKLFHIMYVTSELMLLYVDFRWEKETKILLTFKKYLYKNEHLFEMGIGQLLYIITNIGSEFYDIKIYLFKTEILLTFKKCLYKNDHLFALRIGHFLWCMLHRN